MARHCWRCDDCVRPDPCGGAVDESGHCDLHRTEREALAESLRKVLPAAYKWAALEAARICGKPVPEIEDARRVPEWAACREAERLLESMKGGAA